MKLPKIITHAEDFQSIKAPTVRIRLFQGIAWGRWGFTLLRFQPPEKKD